MNNGDREWLKTIDKKLDNHSEKLSKIEEQNKNQYKQITEIKNCLFGNGHEGLFATVTKHKVYFALLGSAITLLGGCIVFHWW